MQNSKEDIASHTNGGNAKISAENIGKEQDFTKCLIEHTLSTMYLPDNFVEKYGNNLAGKSSTKK